MLKHVLKQMKDFEGGLGDKAEDWVDHMHQSGHRLRLRFRTVKSFNVRAKAMSRAIQMNSNPGINEQIKGCMEDLRPNHNQSMLTAKGRKELNAVSLLSLHTRRQERQYKRVGYMVG